MNFKFSESEETFREELKTWLNAELANQPGENSNPDSDWEFNLTMRRKLAEKGWLTFSPEPDWYRAGDNEVSFHVGETSMDAQIPVQVLAVQVNLKYRE